jgi:hypothetical protein
MEIVGKCAYCEAKGKQSELFQWFLPNFEEKNDSKSPKHRLIINPLAWGSALIRKNKENKYSHAIHFIKDEDDTPKQSGYFCSFGHFWKDKKNGEDTDVSIGLGTDFVDCMPMDRMTFTKNQE